LPDLAKVISRWFGYDHAGQYNLAYSFLLRETLIKYLYRHAGVYQHPRLHGCRRYDYMEVIGRVEFGTETESDSGRI